MPRSIKNNRQAKSRWVASIMRDNFSSSCATLEEIRTDIQRDFCVDVSYYRLWKVNELKLEEIHSNWEESYSLLPLYGITRGTNMLARSSRQIILVVFLGIWSFHQASSEENNMHGRFPSN